MGYTADMRVILPVGKWVGESDKVGTPYLTGRGSGPSQWRQSARFKVESGPRILDRLDEMYWNDAPGVLAQIWLTWETRVEGAGGGAPPVPKSVQGGTMQRTRKRPDRIQEEIEEDSEEHEGEDVEFKEENDGGEGKAAEEDANSDNRGDEAV